MTLPYRPTEEEIKTFQEDGAICLRNVFDSSWIEKITRGIEKNLKDPSQYSECLTGAGGAGAYFNDFMNWQKIEEFRDFAFNSGVAELAGRLMQSKYAIFYYEHILTKDPGTAKVTPWHHDQAYYPMDGMKNCSIWMPIDPVSLDSTIQFVRGSHRWGKWFFPQKFATNNQYVIKNQAATGGKEFESMPDIDADPEKYEVLQWEMQPGDCVVFHMMCVHGARANMTDTPRRVISTRWLGDDCVLAERPWVTSPPVTGGLKLGDNMECEMFPRAWTATA